MTVFECKQVYGTISYTPQYGQTLTDVCRVLYNSDDEFYRYILTEVNHLVNWWFLTPDIKIEYISKEYTQYIDAPLF